MLKPTDKIETSIMNPLMTRSSFLRYCTFMLSAVGLGTVHAHSTRPLETIEPDTISSAGGHEFASASSQTESISSVWKDV